MFPEIAIAVALIGLLGVLITARTDRQISRAQEQHEIRLALIEQRQAKELEEFSTRKALNEQNLARVVAKLILLKDSGRRLIDALRGICLNGHEVDDAKVLEDTLAIVSMHREVREHMKSLFGEIRPKDYQWLQEFHKYQGEILLDIARTKAERRERVAVMQAHAAKLASDLHYIEQMARVILQPKLKGP